MTEVSLIQRHVCKRSFYDTKDAGITPMGVGSTSSFVSGIQSGILKKAPTAHARKRVKQQVL